MPSTRQERQTGHGGSTDSSPQTGIDKLAYTSPKVEKAVLDDALSPDVFAEWSGSTPSLPSCADAAGSFPSKDQNNTSFDWSLTQPASYPNRSATWKHQCDVLEFPLDGEALIFHSEMNLLCQLNETAYFIWKHCDGRSVDEVAIMLTNAFHVDLDTATDHVMRIIELFSISGFVVEESLHAVPS
jgi:hypothetical protein